MCYLGRYFQPLGIIVESSRWGVRLNEVAYGSGISAALEGRRRPSWLRGRPLGKDGKIIGQDGNSAWKDRKILRKSKEKHGKIWDIPELNGVRLKPGKSSMNYGCSRFDYRIVCLTVCHGINGYKRPIETDDTHGELPADFMLIFANRWITRA